ncbi:hypothetical protein HG530_001391 [Fusarium avenaceum]|nr:hypothetical protein HG530_001391 [Fusarium avenaceum]
MRSQLSHFALWVAASQFILFSPVVDARHEARMVHSDLHNRRATKDLWPIDEKTQKVFNKIQHSPAHQNPDEAPPVQIPSDALALNKTASKKPTASHLQSRNVNLFQKRDALRCDGAPCIDGSCCGKNSICGYGPDYCGDGCQSQCDATAMCGEFSEDADMPCGMKLCCSATGWCGTTDVYCNNADPVHKTLPCQAGYGSCSITGPPSCAKGSGGSSARTIGYYQSWNTRTRLCNKVSPKQLDTTKYTHIFFSFAFIDPVSFKIAPAHPDDIQLMKEFTSLASSKLKTWIAIGGFDFSNPEVATHKTCKPAPCTGFGGVMSLVEIEQLIKKRNIKPQYLPDSMMKQITWDDQWIGYDDDETFAAKRAFADSLCFGGTMIWSIDFQVPGSGSPDEPEVVYLDPAVYEGTPAQCTGPCQFVFPPRALGSTTTISLQPYTTSIELKPGVTTTLTIKPPPIVTNSIDYYNVNIKSNQGTKTITPIASLTIVPITTTVTLQGGETQVRTLTLPPWPAISGIPTGGDKPVQTRPPTNTRPVTLRPAKPLPPLTSRPFPEYPGDIDESEPDPTNTWPPEWEIIPVESEVPEEGDEDDNDHDVFYVSCKLWFFSMCIDWPDFGIKIRGWKWNLPVGTHGPFPPPIPRIKFPPGFTFKGKLPPWPKLTRAPDGTFKPPPKPANCELEEASFCYTTESYATTVSKGVTKTTASKTMSTCATVTACNLPDVDATKTEKACKLTRRAVEFANMAEATGMPKMQALHERAEPDWGCEKPGLDGIIILKDRTSTTQRDAIKNALVKRDAELKKVGTKNGHYEVRSNQLGYTAFFFVNSLGPVSWDFLKGFSDNIQAIYRPGEKKANAKRNIRDDAKKEAAKSENRTMFLHKRATQHEEVDQWHLSMISWDKEHNFNSRWIFPNENILHDSVEGSWSYRYDDSLGSGQTIYVMESDWPLGDPEYAHVSPREVLPTTQWGTPQTEAVHSDSDHGFFVGAYAVGTHVGFAANANLAFVRGGLNGGNLVFERFVEGFMLIADDAGSARVGRNKGVVNMSFGASVRAAAHADMAVVWCELMVKMEADLGIAFVLAGNYEDRPTDSYPDLCMPNLKAGYLVGAVDINGVLLDVSAEAEDPDTFAPGIHLPYPPEDEPRPRTGTSFAAPLVAGLVAYFRALPGSDPEPQAIRTRISEASRAINWRDEDAVPVIWNEQTQPDAVEDQPPSDGDCGSDAGSNGKRGLGRRQSCQIPGGGPNPRGPAVTYKPGPPGPLCSNVCGKLCQGFWCSPNPTGTNPDFSNPTSPAGNNGGGGEPAPNPLPGLPDLPTTTDGSGVPVGKVCLASTTAVQCNGGPRGGVCQTSTSCISTGNDPNFPTLAPAPWQPPTSPDGATCASSTTWTLLGGPKGQATITSSACASWKPKATPTPTPSPSPKGRCITAHTYMRNCLGSPDSMYVQVWENGILTCDSGNGIWFASDRSVYRMDCAGKAKVSVTDNGSELTYTSDDGFSITGKNYKRQSDTQVCGTRPGRNGMPDVDIQGFLFENTFMTNNSSFDMLVQQAKLTLDSVAFYREIIAMRFMRSVPRQGLIGLDPIGTAAPCIEFHKKVLSLPGGIS